VLGSGSVSSAETIETIPTVARLKSEQATAGEERAVIVAT
jgi:hypothetical protein